MTRILLSANADRLAEALSAAGVTAAVEAEYGDKLVKGSLITMAHHGPRAGQLAPCAYPNFNVKVDVIGISHVDLDTLGGVSALLGRKPNVPLFWEVAEFVDLNGPHKLRSWYAHKELSLPTDADAVAEIADLDQALELLDAYWAWSEARKVFAPRDGSVLDVTSQVLEGVAFLETLLGIAEIDRTSNNGFAEARAAIEVGKAWRRANEELEAKSYVATYGDVLLRSGEGFTNHLYEHGNKVFAAVVGFRTDNNSVTVSLADPVPGVSCRLFVQSLWGPEAGGHDGIAGGPRDKPMTMEIAHETAQVFAVALYNALGQKPLSVEDVGVA